jgi:parvulin-like peptidyl-prolyl isomerase
MVNKVPITKSKLDLLVMEYKKKLQKQEVTAEEKKRLLKNIIIRQLILQQPSSQALRSEEKFIEKVKEYENKLIITYFLGKHVGSKLKVTEEELNKFYQDNRDNFKTDQKVAARVILLKTEVDAEKVLTRIRRGEDFGQLAKEFSLDLPTAEKGGSMGIVEKKKVFPEIGEVLFSLKAGEISEVVKTKYGYNVFMVDEILPPDIKPFEEAREDIKKSIVRDREGKAFDEMTKKLEKGAQIKIFENRLSETNHGSQ